MPGLKGAYGDRWMHEWAHFSARQAASPLGCKGLPSPGYVLLQLSVTVVVEMLPLQG